MPNGSSPDHPRDRWSTRRVAAVLIPLFVLFAYPLGFWPGYLGANQSAHGFLALALYEGGTTKLDGPILDYFVSNDLVFRNGSFYSNKPPGPGFALVPVALLLDVLTPGRVELVPLVYVGRLLLVTVPFILLLFWMGRALERFVPPAGAWGLVLAYALGTGAAAYSSLLFSHQIAAIGLVSALLLLRAGGGRRAVAAGLAAGFAVLSEYQVFPIALVLTAYAAWRSGRFRWGTLLPFGAGAVPMAALLLIYNAAAFGGATTVSYVPEFEHNALPSAAHLGFTTPVLTKVLALSFSPALGLFFFSPWLLLAGWAAIAAWRGRATERGFVLTCLVAGATLPIVIACHAYWVGGAIAGPRYLLAGVPFLVFPIAAACGTARGRTRRWAAGALVAGAVVSVVLFGALITVNPNVNTDESALLQNPLTAFIIPLFGHGVTNFTLLSRFGAPNALSFAVHLLLIAVPLAIYAWGALAAAGAFRRVVGVGLAAGLALAVVWMVLGESGSAVATRHVEQAATFLKPEAIPRDEDGVVFMQRPTIVTARPVACTVTRHDPALDRVLPPDATFEKVAKGFVSVETALWHPDGKLLCVDPRRNSIHALDPGTSLETDIAPTGYFGAYLSVVTRPGTYGLAFDAAGRLTFSGGAMRAIARRERNGDYTVLVGGYDGKRINGAQDVLYRSDGTLYFSDAPLSLPTTYRDPMRDLPYSGIFRVKDGAVTLASDALEGPLGLAFSPDESVLYVGDWRDRKKRLIGFDVARDGALGEPRVLFDTGEVPSPVQTGGLLVDEGGTIYLTANGGVWILSPEAKPIGFIAPPWRVHGLAWGGADRRSLYLLCGTVVLRVRLRVGGRVAGTVGEAKG